MPHSTPERQPDDVRPPVRPKPQVRFVPTPASEKVRNSVEKTEPVGVASLTARQERFVQEFMVDLNATQAAIRAGYSPNGAAVTASKLLTNAKVVAAVADAKQQRAKRVGVTADRVVRELARIGFSNVEHYVFGGPSGVELDPLAPAGAMRALSSVKQRTRTVEAGEATIVTNEIEFRLWDKVAALTKLGQHLGLFDEDARARGPLEVHVVFRHEGRRVTAG